MKVVSIVGARPQFIKAAPVIEALREAGHEGYLAHTGQHYDHLMSSIFFDEMGIPEPDVNLGVGSGPHGWQTGRMLMRIEEMLLAQEPEWVVVFGDTNSTLAGALAACKLRIPLAHVEAGMRSFNREMPEEHNRVLTDHCSDLLLCPTQNGVKNLAREGITDGVHFAGDTMYDAVLKFAEIARQRSTILQDLNLASKGYLLATVHRAYNTDVPENLLGILTAFTDIDEPIVFPVHPRTRQKIAELDGALDLDRETSCVRMIEPVGYLDMLMLEQHARLVLTDSGGMQKEAYWFDVPCVTLRHETEWVETVEVGMNVVVGARRERIVEAVRECAPSQETVTDIFGDGRAGKRIVELIGASTS